MRKRDYGNTFYKKNNKNYKELHERKDKDESYHAKRDLAKKTSECYSEILEFICEKTNNGVLLEKAILEVKNSQELLEKYPQIKEVQVQNIIFTAIRRCYYKKNKKEQSNSKEEEIDF